MVVEKKLRMTKEYLKRIGDVVTTHDFCHPIFVVRVKLEIKRWC
jgi:hypothetical protein